MDDSPLAASAAFLAFQASRRSRFKRSFASSGVSSFGGSLLVEGSGAGDAVPFVVGNAEVGGPGEAVLDVCRAASGDGVLRRLDEASGERGRRESLSLSLSSRRLSRSLSLSLLYPSRSRSRSLSLSLRLSLLLDLRRPLSLSLSLSRSDLSRSRRRSLSSYSSSLLRDERCLSLSLSRSRSLSSSRCDDVRCRLLEPAGDGDREWCLAMAIECLQMYEANEKTFRQFLRRQLHLWRFDGLVQQQGLSARNNASKSVRSCNQG